MGSSLRDAGIRVRPDLSKENVIIELYEPGAEHPCVAVNLDFDDIKAMVVALEVAACDLNNELILQTLNQHTLPVSPNIKDNTMQDAGYIDNESKRLISYQTAKTIETELQSLLGSRFTVQGVDGPLSFRVCETLRIYQNSKSTRITWDDAMRLLLGKDELPELR